MLAFYISRAIKGLALAASLFVMTACDNAHEVLLRGVWENAKYTNNIWVFTANGRFMKWNWDNPHYHVQGQFNWQGFSSVEMLGQREINGMLVTLEPDKDNISIESLSETDLKLASPKQQPGEGAILFKRLNGERSPSAKLSGVWVSDPGTPVENRFIQSVKTESGSDAVTSTVPDSEQLDLKPDGTWTIAALPISQKRPLPDGPLPVWWVEGDQIRLFIGWPPRKYMELPVRFENDGRVFLGKKGPYRYVGK
jgi:hypothetical protein